MRRLSHNVSLLIVLAIFLWMPHRAAAYSVLAHEALVDSAWADVIAPILRQRFPGTTEEQIAKARAFAYGGAVVQDLGYYPFGSKFFTDLLHYVRSGDFIESLIRNARMVDEYAFALGALAHYSADNTGHPVAVNRSVPLIYPKLRQKFGPVVTYNDDPKRHVMVEFAFDVVQVVGNGYQAAQYQGFVGFEVCTELLERAFQETYGLEMKDLFANIDLAVGTYRYTVGTLIPDITRAAWKSKQDDIRKRFPDIQQNKFVYSLNRQDYEKQFGTMYRKPGILARFIVFMVRILPKVGPLSALAFRPPTPEAERLFVESFNEAQQRYRAMLDLTRRGRLNLPNTDFDTGKPTMPAEYARADETYMQLRERLAQKKQAEVPLAVRRDVDRFFGSGATP